MRPARLLEQGAQYTLVCEALAGAGGNAPIEKPEQIVLRARPAAAVMEIEPAGGDVPADEVAIAVKFATPVALDPARKAISSAPAIPRLEQGELSEYGTTYTVTTDLDAHTAYRVVVARLVDTYGQPLAAPAEHTFTRGDSRPRISMERGLFALEASAKGYPVWTRAVSNGST